MPTIFVYPPEAADFPLANYPSFVAVNDRIALAFDDSTDETVYFDNQIAHDRDFGGGYALKIYFIMASATSGSVRWQAAFEAVTPGDATDLDATTSFDTASSVGVTVPGTAGYLTVASLSFEFNIDGFEYPDYLRISINRDADGTSGTDDAAGDAYVLAVELYEYIAE